MTQSNTSDKEYRVYHVHHMLEDGTLVSAQPRFMPMILDIERVIKTERQQWIANLRARGIRAAHPDDGWVKRTDDPSVHLAYPQFNDGLGVGDLLALGWPDRKTRIVRITRVEPWRFGIDASHVQMYFEEVGDAAPS